jgi:hypothetical protein
MAEMRNLKRHGTDYVGLFERLRYMPKVIEMMRKVGLKTDKIFVTADGGDSSIWLGMRPDSAFEMAKKWVDMAKSAGAGQVYLYLIDEARGKTLAAERPIAQGIRRAGAKTWVAGYADYFPIAGDFIDAPVIAYGPVAPELVKKIHGVGAKVYCYANPQGGVERPEVYRRNYGLLLWQADYDGAFDWCWWWGFGPDNIDGSWNDFDYPVYRDHMMVYPTKSGVVDTIQWEGYREGVDDCRYMATLLREIGNARGAGRVKAAEAAEKWVKSLKSGGPAALTDLDAVRAEMIRNIEACRGENGAAATAPIQAR